jgi:hypothetical protein
MEILKRSMRSAAWLYPAPWRARYGDEFEALLDDAPLRWPDLADVIRGAAIMQMTNWSYWKAALTAGFAGLILAGGWSFTIPDRYVCTAALLLQKGPDSTGQQAIEALQMAKLRILGRDNLVALVRNPRLNLYPNELQRYSIEDVADGLFRKHVKIVPYGGAGNTQPFRIMFEYPDKYKARALVMELDSEFMSWMNTQGRSNSVTILENPMVPEAPTGPVRLAFVIFGAIGGSLLGIMSLGVWRHTRTYAVVTMSIPRETKQFAESRIAAGPYRDLGEYVRELIRADQEKQD